MKRQIISSILVFTSLFSLSACGASDSSNEVKTTDITLNSSQSSSNGDLNYENQSLTGVKKAAKKLSISVCWDYYNIDEAVKLFKQTHPDVDITLHSYDNDSTKYKTQTVTNLMAGTSDDIVDGTELPIIKLANSGLLAGFYPLMEKDSGFIKNDYYTNVFEAMNYQKQLYLFPVGFAYQMVGINTTADTAIVSKYNQYATISDSELLNLYNKNANKNNFYVSRNFNPLYFLSTNFDQYVNYEQKKCNFQNDDFIHFIADVKNVMEPSKSGSGVSYGIDSRQDAYDVQKYLFQEIYTDFYLLKYKEFSNFAHFIPKADPDGNVYIFPTMRFCISEKSQNKELAWEFLKFLTLPETNRQIKLVSNINKTTFKEKEKSELEKSVKDVQEQYNLYPEGNVQQNILDVVNYYDRCNQMPMRFVSLENYLDILIKDIDMLNKGVMTPEQLAKDLQNKISLSLME